MNPGLLTNNITASESGIWKTPATTDISYTENGHELIKSHEENSFWFAHRLRCLSLIIEKYSPKLVLDIGGGNGQFSKHLQSEGIETILLEPGPSGAHNAKRNGIHHVINGALEDAAFNSDSVDNISLLDVLEHIEDDKAFLNEIQRILVPGGKLILTVPAYQSLYSDFDREVGHFRRYNLKTLNKKLKEAGFEIRQSTYLFSFIPVPLFIGRFFINRFKKKEKRKTTGHIKKTGVLGILLAPICWIERVFVRNHIRIPFGSSCLVVAQKNKSKDV